MTEAQTTRMEDLQAMEPMDTESPVDDELAEMGLVTITYHDGDDELDLGPWTETELTTAGWAWEGYE